MERFNGTVLKIILIAGIEKKNWKSEIHEGDTVLVKQLHKTNKLTPNFEPIPSQVIRKDGDAVIVQSPGGPLHIRNSAHVKKFIPTAVTTGVGDITEAVQPTVSTPTRVEPQEAVLTTASPEVVPVTAPRPGRARNAPAWMKDFVSK